MSKPKVLYVLHNHPGVRHGGVEAYALDLYRQMRAAGEFEPILLARVGAPNARGETFSHPGTPFSCDEADPNQPFVLTELERFDLELHTLQYKSLYTRHFRDFLLAHRPDIVHFQHTLFLGYDLIPVTRLVLPDAPIVYTLHDYWPICNNEGTFVRTADQELCMEASPRRCHECFPTSSPQGFFLRTRFVKSRIAEVDLFHSPSRFLRERYIDWGLPEAKIVHEPLGLRPAEPVPESGSRPRTRLGFFGQLGGLKGVDVLLEAMELVERLAPEARLFIHGANLDVRSEEFQERFRRLVAERERNVVFCGEYARADLPRLMADIDWVVVPSIWWENYPLVIHEAFLHRRPVICSGIGGMAEAVADGVNGLYARAGDRVSFADTLCRAVSTPGLWEKLRDGIPPVHSLDEHVARMIAIYRDLIEARRSATRARKEAEMDQTHAALS